MASDIVALGPVNSLALDLERRRDSQCNLNETSGPDTVGSDTTYEMEQPCFTVVDSFVFERSGAVVKASVSYSRELEFEYYAAMSNLGQVLSLQFVHVCE